jgi:hypothetical protein
MNDENKAPSVPLEVYCDASVSPAIMDGLTSSKLGNQFMGRIAILVPAKDFGFLESSTANALTPKGNSASTQMEILAVKRAKELSDQREFGNYVILTDNKSAFEQSGISEVRWLEAGRIHYASLFLARIMGRAGYLRSSSRKVISRAKPTKLQEEVLRMFQAERLEFRLSESMLWQKIRMEMAATREV